MRFGRGLWAEQIFPFSQPRLFGTIEGFELAAVSVLVDQDRARLRLTLLEIPIQSINGGDGGVFLHALYLQAYLCQSRVCFEARHDPQAVLAIDIDRLVAQCAGKGQGHMQIITCSDVTSHHIGVIGGGEARFLKVYHLDGLVTRRCMNIAKLADGGDLSCREPFVF